METEFQPKGQSINDIVAREVQKEVSKLQTATPSGAVKQSFGKTDSRALTAKNPDPTPEAEMHPRCKIDEVVLKPEVKTNLINIRSHSLVVVLLMSRVANRQKTPSVPPKAP